VHGRIAGAAAPSVMGSLSPPRRGDGEAKFIRAMEAGLSVAGEQVGVGESHVQQILTTS